MADCTVFYDEIRFNVRDAELTHVYVFIRCEGDCPFMVHGWHHKAYPASVPTKEIMAAMWGGDGPLSWERQAPPAMGAAPIFSPQACVPVPVEQLQAWHAAFAYAAEEEGARNVEGNIELADEITARLTTSPDWDKACPTCRARNYIEQRIMEQQG